MKTNNEVAVAVKLEDAGLTLAAKSRAISAIDRLVGNIVDIIFLGNFLESLSKTSNQKTEIHSRLKAAEANAAANRLNRDPNFGSRLAQQFLIRETRKQENKEAVAEEAVEALSLGSSQSDEDTKEIDEDWINRFETYAEQASSEGLRQVWGRLLAAEVRRPGNISLATMRIVSELSPAIAQQFEELTRYVIFDDFLVKSEEIENSSWNMFRELEDFGLIANLASPVIKRWPDKGIGSEVAFLLRGRFMLRGVLKVQHIEGLSITKSGQEIRSIFPNIHDKHYCVQAAIPLCDFVESLELVGLGDRLPSGSWQVLSVDKIK